MDKYVNFHTNILIHQNFLICFVQIITFSTIMISINNDNSHNSIQDDELSWYSDVSI